ncbi:MAG: tRNA adenosine(34) deaminase TadA [Chloroflexota bacterium]
MPPAGDERFMREALKQARRALAYDDVPIGAVLVSEGEIIARAYNQVEKKRNGTAHAEIIAIEKALKKTNIKWLLDATLYVTLEPCAMCAGAIVLARIPRVVFGAFDPKAGGCGSVTNVAANPALNHRAEIVSGVLEAECSQLIKDFFKDIRRRKKNGG